MRWGSSKSSQRRCTVKGALGKSSSRESSRSSTASYGSGKSCTALWYSAHTAWSFTATTCFSCAHSNCDLPDLLTSPNTPSKSAVHFFVSMKSEHAGTGRVRGGVSELRAAAQEASTERGAGAWLRKKTENPTATLRLRASAHRPSRQVNLPCLRGCRSALAVLACRQAFLSGRYE